MANDLPIPGAELPARILMVDDHPPNLVALEAILAPLEQELVLAHSGEDALRKLLQDDFAVILMDVQMPRLDGIETARLIKERPRNRHVPIIFLTAIHRDPSYIFRGYKEGAVDYLLKPFDPEILRAKVSVFVDLWRKGEVVKRQQALLAAQELVEAERRNETRFRSLTDSMPQCVWAARADGEIYFCNRVWRDYAGPDAGMDFFSAAPAEERDAALASFREAVRSGQPMEREQRLRRHDGEYRWHLCRMVPDRNEAGALQGWICTATDIDQKKRIEEANQQLLVSEKEARAQAEVANRMKDEFLATVSHELRTPLNAILGWTRMLRTGAVQEKQLAKVLETIERNAKAQTQLIEDILDVSRIIAGKMRINLVRTDLGQVIHSAMDAVRPAAEAKGVELLADLAPDAVEFCGDPDRLQQVVWNLVSNAIKFTPRGGKVYIVLSRVESQVEIKVSDTGMGISPEFLPHVFDRFRQADSSITRMQGGLGLGLAIVRHLVEVHGGVVEARSEGEGKGAEFRVRMPVRAVVPAPAPESSNPESKLLEGVEVLLVEDEPEAQELVTAVLTRHAAVVRVVSSPDEAVEAVRNQRPTVVLSDIGLEHTDGYEVIQRIRELEPELPAAALTARAGENDHRLALAAGFHAHVTKPIDPTDLLVLVASLAGRGEAARSQTPPALRPVAFPA